MDLYKALLEFVPAITAIFRLGFIPSPFDFYELTEEQYEAYQKQSGDMSKPIYTIIPKNYKYLDTSNKINIVKMEELNRLGEAALFLHIYAMEGGCESQNSDDVLRFAADRLPRVVSDGTKLERPTLKLLKPGEKHLTEKEEWVDFLASVIGEGQVLNIRVTKKDKGEISEISIPIEKQR